MKTQAIGQKGEAIAARYLKWRFYRILARNYTVRPYEIDIVAETPFTRVFVEVKTRRMAPSEVSKYGMPADAVNAQKRYFVTQAAKTYTALHPTHKKLRFDVIEVYLSRQDPQKTLAVRHMKDAFRAYS